MPKDLRTYLDLVRSHLPEQFLQVDREVDPKLELSAVVRRSEIDRDGAMIQFTRVAGTSFPVLCNLFGNRDRIDLVFGTARDQTVEEYHRRMADALPTEQVDSGPVKDVRITGGDVDLTRLPQIVHAAQSAGPYITAAVAIVRDPRTGIYNAGIYRVQIVGSSKLRMNPGPGSHLEELYHYQEARDQPLDVALSIGHYPTLHMASQYRGSLDVDELELAGALAGEALRLTPAETLDLDVPADSEFVIEARLMPHGREQEGPFVEYAQLPNAGEPNPVAEVTAITHRSDAIFHDILGARADHNNVGVLAREAQLLERARAISGSVKTVSLPTSGSCRFTAYISMHDPPPGLARNVGLGVLGAIAALKLVVLVNDDVDVHNESDMLWAMATRLQADHDITVIPGTRVTAIDPAAHTIDRLDEVGPLNAKTLIDATVQPSDPTYRRGDVPLDLLSSIVLDDYVAEHTGR